MCSGSTRVGVTKSEDFSIKRSLVKSMGNSMTSGFNFRGVESLPPKAKVNNNWTNRKYDREYVCKFVVGCGIECSERFRDEKEFNEHKAAKFH